MNPVAAKATANKNTRLNIRATPDEKRLLEQAADASHVSASQFVMQAALESAHEVLADQTRFVLSSAEWDSFSAMLDRPARRIPALERAASKPSPFREK